MKRVVSLALVVLELLSMVACGQKAPTWQEQYDLGVRYLSEGNYEEAIIAFSSAIDIEPKRAEFYLGLSDAYIGLGDYEAAIATLNQGLDMCSDEESIHILLDKLGEIENEGVIDRLLRVGATENLLKYEEISFFGKSIDEVDRSTAKDILSQNGFTCFYDFDDGLSSWQNELWVGTTVGVFFNDDESMSDWCIVPDSRLGVSNLSAVATGLRDIYMLDSPEDVLAKLGFSNATEILREIYTTFDNYMYGTSMPTFLANYTLEYGEGNHFHIQISLHDETISENVWTARVDGTRLEPGQYLYLGYRITVYDNEGNDHLLQFDFDENNNLDRLYMFH